jgi:hypothetical protein
LLTPTKLDPPHGRDLHIKRISKLTSPQDWHSLKWALACAPPDKNSPAIPTPFAETKQKGINASFIMSLTNQHAGCERRQACLLDSTRTTTNSRTCHWGFSGPLGNPRRAIRSSMYSTSRTRQLPCNPCTEVVSVGNTVCSKRQHGCIKVPLTTAWSRTEPRSFLEQPRRH